METVEIIANLTCRVFITGKGKKSIVLLHGWGQTHAFWDDLIPVLEHVGYTVYSLDLPGFGYSDVPLTAWSIKDYAYCLHEFVVQY